MKLFEVIVTEKKKRGDTTPVKTRPILVVADNAKGAKEKITEHWGTENYKWKRPNMIADFNPK